MQPVRQGCMGACLHRQACLMQLRGDAHIEILDAGGLESQIVAACLPGVDAAAGVGLAKAMADEVALGYPAACKPVAASEPFNRNCHDSI